MASAIATANSNDKQYYDQHYDYEHNAVGVIKCISFGYSCGYRDRVCDLVVRRDTFKDAIIHAININDAIGYNNGIANRELICDCIISSLTVYHALSNCDRDYYLHSNAHSDAYRNAYAYCFAYTSGNYITHKDWLADVDDDNHANSYSIPDRFTERNCDAVGNV